jgi:two-component system C4-dicarboxylate transport sensor histidine kinase DctB
VRRAWAACAGLLLIALVAWAAHGYGLQRGLERVGAAAQQRLEVEAARLDGQLSRFEYLPSLLETSPEVLRLLAAPGDAVSRESVSRYLKALNAIAGTDNLYVLDRAGTALAAADFEQPGTPVGQDLSYRPYMRDALTHGRGAFYGVGITSARAGYYLSYALPARGEARGVATVKVDLQAIEHEWRELPGDVLMLDEHGVVIWRRATTGSTTRWRRSRTRRGRRHRGLVAMAARTWRRCTGRCASASARAPCGRWSMPGPTWSASMP